jgi:hypothetical protein
MQKQGFAGAKTLGSFRSLVGSGSGAVRPGYTPNTKPSFDSNSYESIAKIKLTAGRFLPFHWEKNELHSCTTPEDLSECWNLMRPFGSEPLIEISHSAVCVWNRAFVIEISWIIYFLIQHWFKADMLNVIFLNILLNMNVFSKTFFFHKGLATILNILRYSGSTYALLVLLSD